MRKLFIAVALLAVTISNAQNKLTPELLWSLGRVNGTGISKDKQFVVYTVGVPDVDQNKTITKTYKVPLSGGAPVEIKNADSLITSDRISPDGKYLLNSDAVKLKNVYGNDFYPQLTKSNVQIYETLNYRHWDTWEDGKFDHVFFSLNDSAKSNKKDIMQGELFDCPQKPFGGDEDFIWNPDSKHILYVTKKKYGTGYAVSTNTDLYEYDITTGVTKNLTESNKGYDISPAYNSKGKLAWLQMKRDGYESDKQDIIIANGSGHLNLISARDDIHVESFKWSENNRDIFFIAPVDGTLQLFSVNDPGLTRMMPVVKQITKGDFDVKAIVGQSGDTLIVAKEDMNHAAELYTLNIKDGSLQQLTHVNDAVYATLGMIKTERRWVTTTDNKKMLVWVIYPPGFEASKKYPSLLYCQGGPQSPISQFYSFRWNFQLIASQGYVVIAPCRRGMPGFGTKWNEQVSKDWGGQVLNDYLSATDEISKESFIDKNRRGCIGASFGGYSVFALAGKHNHRFKTFISHDGIFDFKSMYGTTEEMFFENWEKGGPYWDKSNAVAQRSFNQSPSNFVDKWNTPIMIVQGGKDFRVSFEQGQQAFQAVQLKGIKSRFLYFPEENHWVLKAQDAMVWQHEFFKWLEETL